MIYPRILPSQKVSRTLLGGILHFPNVLYVFFCAPSIGAWFRPNMKR